MFSSMLFHVLLFDSQLSVALRFPFKMFYGIPDGPALELVKNKSCDTRVGESWSNSNCCDCQVNSDFCEYDGTCCVDWLMYQNGMREGNRFTKFIKDQYIAVLKRSSLKRKAFQCLDAFPYFKGENKTFYLMIGTCAEGSNKNDEDACNGREVAQVQSQLPVFGSDGVLYRNFYCARCNFAVRFRPVDYRVSCVKADNGKNESVPDFVGGTLDISGESYGFTCTHAVANQDSRIKGCKPVIWDKRCPKDSPYYHLCEAYIGLFLGYRNYHCWLCHQEKYTAESACPIFEPNIAQNNLYLEINITYNEFCFISLFSQEPNGVYRNTMNIGRLLFYNPIEMKPELQRCPAMYERDLNFTCIHSASKKHLKLFDSMEFKCALKNFTSVTLQLPFESTYKLARMIPPQYLLYERGKVYLRNTYISKFIEKLTTSMKFREDILSVVLNISLLTDRILDAQLPQSIIPDASQSANRMCMQSRKLPVLHVTPSCNVNPKKGNFIPSSYMMTSLHLYPGEGEIRLFQCLKFQNVSTTAAGATAAGGDECVSNYSSNSTADSSSLAVGNGAHLCSDEKVKELPTLSDTFVVIATVLSFLCYVAVLLKVRLHARVLVGVAFLFYCSSLLLYDMLFLIAPLFRVSGRVLMPYMCKALGLMKHAAFLLVLLTSLLTAVDLFRKQSIMVSPPSVVRYFRDRGLLFLVPILVVVFSIVLESQGVMSIGYSTQDGCDVTGFYGRIAFYTIPMALSYVAIFVLLSIDKYRRGQDKVQKTPYRLIISFLMLFGVIEIISLMRSTDSLEMSYAKRRTNIMVELAAKILRGIRGVLFFVLYVFQSLRCLPWNNNIQPKTESRIRLKRFNSTIRTSIEGETSEAIP